MIWNNVNANSLYQRYISTTDQVSSLTRENHLLFYKYELAKQENDKLSSKIAVKQEEMNGIKEELRSVQNDLFLVQTKYNQLSEMAYKKSKSAPVVDNT